MAIPLIAASAAARAVAKKLATRAVAGITGAGAKQVAPVYREMGTGSVKVVKPMDPKVSSKWQTAVNKMSTEETLANKSGSNATQLGKYQEKVNSEVIKVSGKTKPVKINSNPMRGK